MRDVSIFPLPLDVGANTLSDENAIYIATEITLGYGLGGDLMAHTSEESTACIQKVIRCLLSKKGSVPSEPNYGSNLYRLLIGYNIATVEEDVILILLDVENQCKASDIASGVPLNAQLDSIELLDIEVDTVNELKISLGVTTVSGIARSFDINI